MMTGDDVTHILVDALPMHGHQRHVTKAIHDSLGRRELKEEHKEKLMRQAATRSKRSISVRITNFYFVKTLKRLKMPTIPNMSLYILF
jgi:hypothetical protein